MKIRGITAVEIALVLLALIGIIVAITPKLISRGERNMAIQCQTNLSLIQSAKESWGHADYRGANEAPTAENLSAFLLGGKMPQCPLGFDYAINRLGEPPECPSGKKGHLLQ